MNEEVDRYDICIIGAGVAGGVLAAYLARYGLRIVVVEKSLEEPDRIVGELLQPGGVLKLQELGLEHLLEGFDAQLIDGYGLFMAGESFRISYPERNGKTCQGRGFRNGKFIQQIRAELQKNPNVKVMEGAATGLIEADGRIAGLRYTKKGEEEIRHIRASLTVVCDGMFSTFREQLSENQKKVSSYFLGMVLKDCVLPYPNHGHVIIAKPSTCLVYPISSSETRILIDFPWSIAPRKSPELNDYLLNTLAPQLPPQLLPSYLNAVNEGKYKVMPNHLIPARPKFKPGAVLLGDALNIRHPLTGAGMTAAFTDILNLGTKLTQIKSPGDLAKMDAAVQQFYATRHTQNATINILADALYGVLSDAYLSAACYEYLKIGGAKAEEPVAILSAISRDDKLLLKHFFAVAFLGVRNTLRPFPTIQKLKGARKMLRGAVEIVHPLVMSEKPDRLTSGLLRFAKWIV